MVAIARYSTPWSDLWVVSHAGVVRSSSFRSADDAVAGWGGPEPVREGHSPEVAAAIEAWVAGDDALFAVPAQQPGTEFLSQVWEAMRLIPAGHPVSYGELARMAGRPKAVRAVGQACARNRLAPFVPCHRVIRTGGALGNYGYGPDLKAALLAHEERMA